MKITKNIIVFYHGECLDGFGGAYVAWKKFKNKADYIALSYNAGGENILKEKNIKILELKDKEIYFIDFCLNEIELKKVEKVAKKLAILDHHISKKDLVESISNSIFRNDVSGSYIAHEYFFSNKKVPKLIEHISIGDTWTFSKDEKKRKIEEYVKSYLGILDFDFKIFQKAEKDLEDKKIFNEKIKIGEILDNVKYKQVKTQSKYSDIIEFDGYKAIALNSTTLASRIGSYLCEQNTKIDFVIIYRFSEGRLKVSFRGRDKIDVSKIAQKYNGGGHFNAASFMTNDKKFINDFIEKIIS